MGRCRSEELKARKSLQSALPAWHPQPVPEPSLVEISSSRPAPVFLPKEGSPCQPAAKAAAPVPAWKPLHGVRSRRGAAASLHPPKAKTEELPRPGEGTPASETGTKQFPPTNTQGHNPAASHSNPLPGLDLQQHVEPRWQTCLLTRAEDVSQKGLTLAGVSAEIRQRGCWGCRRHAHGIIASRRCSVILPLAHRRTQAVGF